MVRGRKGLGGNEGERRQKRQVDRKVEESHWGKKESQLGPGKGMGRSLSNTQ